MLTPFILEQILTNAWSITVDVVITARNGVLAMSVPAPLVMKWTLRIRIALVTKLQFLIIHFQFLGRALFTSSVLVAVFSPCHQTVTSASSIWLTRERLCMNRVRSLFNIRCILLGNSLEPGPYNRVLGTAGSVMTIGLPLNGCLHSKNKFDERKQDWLVQKFGCGDFKGLTRFLMPV